MKNVIFHCKAKRVYTFSITMKKIKNQTFKSFNDRDSGNIFSGFEFNKCHFEGCSFSTTEDVNLRSIAEDMTFINCEITGGHIGPGIVRNITINGLKVWNHLQTFGTVFEHVVVKGVINKMMLTPYVDLMGHFPDIQHRFNKANSEFYRNVDWALDISEAIFKDCDIRGIPANLIIRDKETQFIMTREKALQYKWQEVDLSKTYWDISIKWFLEEGYEDCILIAPRKSPKFKILLEGLNKLQDIGALEPG